MLKFKLTADEHGALPENQKSLYEGDSEKGFELQVDLTGSPIKIALEDERGKAKTYLSRLKGAGLDPENDGKSDREKELEAENEKLREQGKENESRKVADKIKRAIEAAARVEGVLESAIADIAEVSSSRFKLTETGEVVTASADDAQDGLTPTEWLKHCRQSRRHWWAASKGTGAAGSDGASIYRTPAPVANPFRATTFSIGAQMEVDSRDPIKAAEQRRQALKTR